MARAKKPAFNAEELGASIMAMLAATGADSENVAATLSAALDVAEEHGYDRDEIMESMGLEGEGAEDEEGEDFEEELEFLEDLEEDDLRELAVKVGAVRKAKAKKMDEDELRDILYEHSDPDALMEAAEELELLDSDDDEDEEDDDDSDDDEGYDEWEKEDLVKEVLERGLKNDKGRKITKAAANKLSEDDLIEMLEEDDEG